MLLTYENEVILTNEVYGDKALPYLVPSYNIRIECPLALVDKVGTAGVATGGRAEVGGATCAKCRTAFLPTRQLYPCPPPLRLSPPRSIPLPLPGNPHLRR